MTALRPRRERLALGDIQQLAVEDDGGGRDREALALADGSAPAWTSPDS
jgi:hypothetical protein